METILEAFLRSVTAEPERVAFIQGNTQLTFGILEQRSLRLAAGLLHAGVKPGMPVGILVAQGLNFPPALLALWRVGAIVVPFDPGAPAEDRAARESIVDLGFIVSDGNPSLSHPTTRILRIAELEMAQGAQLPPPVPPGSEALFAFTSGSTGRPKALVHTHASLSAWVRRSIDPGGKVIRDDVVLAIIPLQLAVGIANLVFAPLLAGATVVLVQPFSPRAALQAAIKHRATAMVTVPGIIKLLADLPESLGRPAFRRINASSATLDISVLERFAARYGARPVRDYGMSEVGLIASTANREETGNRAIVGWPVVDLRLLGEDGQPVPAGEAGDIAIRSDSLCQPYCIGEGGLREPLPMRDGFFMTGDVGRLEPDGALVLIGRKKAFINGPRLRIDPKEVEAVLLRMPGVRDATVVPSPGRYGYEDIHAFVAADASVSEAGVASFCAAHLSAGKRPQIIDFVETIPRNAAGKVETWRLRTAACRA